MNDEDFKKKAEAYIERSKSKGVSNIAIYNTIKLKYAEFLSDKAAEREKAEKDRQFSLQDRELKLREETSRQTTSPKIERDALGNPIQWNAQLNRWENVEAVDPDVDLRSGLENGDDQSPSETDGTSPNMAKTTPFSVLPGGVQGPVVPENIAMSQPNVAQENLDKYAKKGILGNMWDVIYNIPGWTSNAIKSGIDTERQKTEGTSNLLFGEGSSFWPK